MFALLQQRTFRHLFSAQVIALFGTGFTSVALALLAYDLAEGDAGLVLGYALALKMLAYVVISPLAGTLSPKVSRRRFMVILDLLRASTVVALPFVDALWQIYLLIFLLNTCSALFTPTFQATIPDILPNEEDYTQALSLSRMAYDLENLLSPTIAALLLTVVNFNALFSLNAIAFVISALLVLSVTLPSRNPHNRSQENPTETGESKKEGTGEKYTKEKDAEEKDTRENPSNSEQTDDSFWYRLSFGIRIYFNTPKLKALMLLNLAISAVGAMQIVNTVVYVRSELAMAESMVPLAFAAAGVGSIAAALSVPKLLKHYSDRLLMLTGSAVMSLVLLGGILKPDYHELLLLWCLIGFSASLVQTPIGLLLRSACQEEDRPALFAAHFSLSHACWLICYPLAGWLGATFDMTTAFIILALTAGLTTLIALITWPKAAALNLWHQHPAQNHQHLHIHDEHHQHNHKGWEGPEPHSHSHQHQAVRHQHRFVIDRHHHHWPSD